MTWGISFKIPATFESYLWEDMPHPSELVRLKRSDGRQTLKVFYHFLYSPQHWREWQRVAAMKVQIQNRIKRVEFIDYEYSDSISGPIYSVSNLGKEFPAFVKFPQPQFPQTKKDTYQKLCRHAKRLVYERMLHLEQLIAVSMWFNEYIDYSKREGLKQTMQRAIAAYLYAKENEANWPKKLSKEIRHKVLSTAAKKSAQNKRSKPERYEALEMYRRGLNMNQISKLIGVNRSTVGRWIKEQMLH
jgi:hypothetical protein